MLHSVAPEGLPTHDAPEHVVLAFELQALALQVQKFTLSTFDLSGSHEFY